MHPSSQIQRSFLFFPELSMNQVFEVQDSVSEEGRCFSVFVSFCILFTPRQFVSRKGWTALENPKGVVTGDPWSQATSAEPRQFVVSSERGEGVRRATSEACGLPTMPNVQFGEGIGRRRHPSATLGGRSLACKTECNAEVSQLKAKLAMKGQNKNVWQGVARVSHLEPMSDEAPSTAGNSTHATSHRTWSNG